MRETNIQSIEKRVYELEKGGGGGGTSNYEQLTNRPKIEGKTLSGNMTFEDLGIASAVDLAQTDGDLQDLADKFSPIYATDESATLDVVLHSVITNERIPENERRTFTVKCDAGWFICDIQRSTDKYVGTALAQSSNDRYTVRGTIGGASTEISPFSSANKISLKIETMGSAATGEKYGLFNLLNNHNFKTLKIVDYINISSAHDGYPIFTIDNDATNRPTVGTILNVENKSITITTLSVSGSYSAGRTGVDIELE